MTTYTLKDMAEYLPRLEARLKATRSAWMRSEVKKSIELCKAEIERLKADESK